MKTLYNYTTLLLILLSVSAYAQWNSDPAAPLEVCVETGKQSDVASFPDGEGGIYTFWSDARTGNNLWDVYGQHYNAEGIAQWQDGGKEIINYEGRANVFRLIPAGDQFIIIWNIQYSTISAENGLYVKRIDANGEPVWPADVKLRGESSYPNSISNIAIVESAGNYYIGSQGVVIGGANKLRISKIDGDGNLLWPFDGSELPQMTGFGSFGLSSDMSGGAYVYHSTGNSLGAGVKCMRIAGTNDISNQWEQWTSVTAGTQGLDGNYSGIGDNTGITFMWAGNGTEGAGTNIYARRLQATNGLLGWNATTKFISIAAGNQARFYWKKSGNNYYVTWSDSRPGVMNNAAVYAQKFTVNGVILWEENGVQLADLGSYIPYPEFDLDENNTMCMAYKATPGFMAQKITTEGTVVWGPACIMALTNGYSPFYSDFNMVYTGGKFLVVSAKALASGGADNIYISKVTVPPVQISETITACNGYAAYGQIFTESDTYVIELPDTVLTLHLTIVQNIAEITLDGNMLISTYDGAFRWKNCDTDEFIEGATGPTFVVTENGSYALEITNGDCVALSECMEVIITSTEEKDAAGYSLFPNPGRDVFNLVFDGESIPVRIQVTDISGRIVYSEQIKTSQTNQTVDLSSEVKGAYFIRIEFDNGRKGTLKWIKL